MEEVGQPSQCEELMGVAYGRVLKQGGINLLALSVLSWGVENMWYLA